MTDIISTTTGLSPFCLRYPKYLRKLCIYNYFNISPAIICFMQISMASVLSTQLNWLYLNWLIEYIQILIKNNYIAIAMYSIFIDLSKAFDTIDHTILISKLEYYGVENNELQWFISYMHNRQQYVEIENIKSTTETITTGVPQGSILGPLLFLIYTVLMT